MGLVLMLYVIGGYDSRALYLLVEPVKRATIELAGT